MRPRFLRLLLCLLPLPLLAQVELSPAQARNWNFGLSVSLSFVDGRPVLNPPTPVDAFEGAASLSDGDGRLAFYTNGGNAPGNPDIPGTIWFPDGSVLFDMQGTVGGGNSARQSAIAFPDLEPDHYWLVTVDDRESRSAGDGRGLTLFLVTRPDLPDARVDNLPRIDPYPEAVEGLDATIRSDSLGYWVVTHNGRDEGGAFGLVHLNFLAGEYTLSEVPAGHPVRGTVRFSPDGRYLYNNGFVHAFDPTDGTIGGVVADVSSFDKNSVTFSADSRYIVARDDNNAALGPLVVRYEIATEEVLQIGRIGGTTPEERIFSSVFQLGPNGNVYFVGNQFASGREGLFEVRCVSSTDPELVPFVLDFPTGSVSAFPSNPPNYVDAIFRQPVSLDTLRGDTMDRRICRNIRAVIEAETPGTEYRWNTGATGRELSVSTSGTYAVTITGDCVPAVEVIRVDLLPAPEVSLEVLGEDAGCSGDTIELAVRSNLPVLRVEWGDGDTTASRRVPVVLGTRLRAIVTTECGTLDVGYVFPEAEPPFTPLLTIPADPLCPGDELTATIDPDGGEPPVTIDWFNGDTTLTTTFPADSNRLISVELTGPCGQSVVLEAEPAYLENCVCRDALPEVFSPNRDGRNDAFGLFTDCRTEDYQLTVFNRWGQAVFSSSDVDRRWAGDRDGTPQPPDVYYYVLTFRYAGQEEVLRRDGEVLLVR